MAKIPFKTPCLIVCMFLICLNVSVPAAVVIDDFTVSQTVTGEAAGVASGDGILGGERDVRVYQQSTEVYINAEYGSGCHIMNTAVDTNYGYAYFTYDGPDGSASNYDISGLGHVDLTGGGRYDGFLITFSQINTTGGYLSMILYQGDDQYGCIHIILPTQAQNVFLPFADFDMNVPCAEPPDAVPVDSLIDFSDVGYINISVSLAPGGSCTIDSIMTVPEPATLILLALGGLIVRRKRKQ